MSTPVPDAALAHFPTDYFHAREKFLALARNRGARVASHPIAARGPNGETLSIETAYIGAGEPRRLLVILSGTHGVEGFAGSALQQQWLDHHTAARIPSDGGCLLLHAVNPYGFAWRRRTNEHNVDLNRNALVRFPGPASPEYRPLNTWLNPVSPPVRGDFFLLRGLPQLLRHGFASLQQAIVEGQYEFPRGLFYGGAQSEESIAIVQTVLADKAWRHVTRAVAIDIHTGVGKFGTYKLWPTVDEQSIPYRQLAQWFGADSLTSNRRAGRVSYRVSGGLTERIAELFPAAQTYACVLEFGTYAGVRVLAALRRENRAFHYAPSDDRVLALAKTRLHEVFCPKSSRWRRRVLEQGQDVLRQAEHACFSAQ